jgi:hypothetical protein
VHLSLGVYSNDMEKIKKINWVRVLTWLPKIAITVAGIAVSCYFAIFLPQHNRAELNFEKQKYMDLKQEDCSKMFAKLNSSFNNVHSTYLAPSTNICMVKYFNASKKIEETPADNFR